MVWRAPYQDEPQPDVQERAHRLIAGNNAAKTYNEAQRRLKDLRAKYPKRSFVVRYYEIPESPMGAHQWQLIEML